jgi:hypothetical protein
MLTGQICAYRLSQPIKWKAHHKTRRQISMSNDELEALAISCRAVTRKHKLWRRTGTMGVKLHAFLISALDVDAAKLHASAASLVLHMVPLDGTRAPSDVFVNRNIYCLPTQDSNSGYSVSSQPPDWQELQRILTNSTVTEVPRCEIFSYSRLISSSSVQIGTGGGLLWA